jgi:hypothetical protein
MANKTSHYLGGVHIVLDAAHQRRVNLPCSNPNLLQNSHGLIWDVHAHRQLGWLRALKLFERTFKQQATIVNDTNVRCHLFNLCQ